MTRSTASDQQETLAELLGGRRGALDATAAPAAFVLGWLVFDHSVSAGALAALLGALVVAVVRITRGDRITAVVVSVAAVTAGALVALHTGRAQDFFLLQLLSNVASALLWAASVVIRWPLLGVVVGVLLGQRTRWRHDPDLVRAYGRASWIWVAQYCLRVAVYALLWSLGSVVALGIARVVLSWPLVAAVLALSAVVLRRSLPPDHPGLRHPRR